MRIGWLEIDTSAKRVMADGNSISLTPREYALLEFLVRRQGEVVSRTTIEQHIYDGIGGGHEQTWWTRQSCALRRKIDVHGRPSLIQTRRGMGYVLQARES